MATYIKIGKLAASHGVHGELILHHHLGKKTALNNVTAIFIEQTADQFMPFFIQKTKIRDEEEILIKLEGIDTPEKARKLTPKEVWLTTDDFEAHSAKSAPITLLGYNIYDQNQILIGEIVEVIEQPHQILCSIIINQKEAYIPIHENNILQLNHKKRQIEVEIPEGLLDIYQ
jgi:16S rRNA processing protein RimM